MKKKKSTEKFTPKFKGNKAKEIKIQNVRKSEAWTFWVDENKFLTLVWDTDTEGTGFFRVFMMGMDGKRPEMKKYTPDTNAPAFVGSVMVKGTNVNDLYASYGFEDEDIHDIEGNITNKPKEVRIYPYQGVKYERK